MSHGDKVESLPDGYNITAVSNNSPIAAYENIAKKYFGLQFHPEVTHTESGITIIKNFLEICGIEQNWSSDDILQQINTLVETEVKDGEVLLALSGGVDSTVLAAELHKTLGNKLTCVMVDHGLLRKDEALNVVNNLKEKIGLSVNFNKCSKPLFFPNLRSITDLKKKKNYRKYLYRSI